MELVTLCNASLYRVGSASNAYIAAQREVSVTTEVVDGSAECLRALVLRIAEENGEKQGQLSAMQEVKPAWNYTNQKGAIVFNIQGRNVQYGTPYAICHAFPALKIGGRYFRLDEVEAEVRLP